MNAVTTEHIAFHGHVVFLGWKDSSAQGPRVNLALSDRNELEHFDKVTRRSAKRAGHRYKAAIGADDRDLHSTELWFCGANWSHQDGARVSFAVADEDLAYWRGLTSRDQNPDLPSKLWLTLVQVTADEQPVNQVKADRVEVAVQPELKGGPNSKHVAILVRDEQFRRFLTEKLGLKELADVETADDWIKEVCGIESKVQLDHEETSWLLFRTEVRRPFLEWMGVTA